METKPGKTVSKGTAKESLQTLFDGKQGILEGLNEEQKAAVTHGEGPLLILAGAGTGKTTVITRRVAWLLEQKKAQPEEILALTFTEKAAAEMAGRLGEALPLGRLPEHISTFHSFGDSLLREFSLDLGLPPTFKVIRDLEQVLLLREHLYDLPLDFFRPRTAPGRHLKYLARFFSRIKQDDISAEEYAERVSGEEARVAGMEESPEKMDAAYDLGKSKEVAACFAKYEELKADAYAVDQTDQVFMAYRLLRDHDVIRKRVCDRFKYILIDEFQDVDIVQAKFVDLLAGTNGNLTVVGDDDQSIYGFRGASVSNILEFPKTHDKAKKVVLTTNYRSTQPILDAGYRLIQRNNPYRLEQTEQIDKQLKAERGDGPAPTVLRAQTVYDEAEAVAERIEEILKDPKVEPNDVVVLTRANQTGEYFRSALLRRKIPVAFEGTGKLYEQPEVKTCLAFLDLVVNPLQHNRLRLLAQSEPYQMPPADLAKLEQAKRESQEELWDLMGEMAEPQYSKQAVAAAQKIRAEIGRFQSQADTLNATDVLYRWLAEHTDWVKREELSEADVLRTQNLSKLFRRIKTFAENATDPSTGGWTEYFQDVLAYGEDRAASELDFEQNAVRVMSAHAAKGLEFKAVFVSGLARDLFPTKPKPEQIPRNLLESANLPENDLLREERRLFYVALTRAKDRITLTSAGDYEGQQVREASQFITESVGDIPVTTLDGTADADPMKRIHDSQPGLAMAGVWSPPEPLTMTHTALAAYLECPLKYYWQEVEHVYVEPDPATEYGNLLHEVIAALNHAKQKGDHISEEKIISLVEDAWKTRDWRFMSSDHRDDTRQKAIEAAVKYWKSEQDAKPPALVEEEFRFSVNGTLFKGRFDRINRDGDYLELIDYKTQEVTTARHAQRIVANSPQLTLYAMGIKERFGKYPDKLTLHFVDSGRTVSTTVTERKVKNLVEKIDKAVAGIKNRDFTPNKKMHYCTPTVFNFCPGNKLPPVRER